MAQGLIDCNILQQLKYFHKIFLIYNQARQAIYSEIKVNEE
jgi:hypothetical protein